MTHTIVIIHDDLGCRHEFPDDWEFGGADGLDPRADGRFEPTTYFYYDRTYTEIFMTQMFWCDEVALDYFTTVQQWGKAIYLWVQRPGAKLERLPILYRPEDDTVYDLA